MPSFPFIDGFILFVFPFSISSVDLPLPSPSVGFGATSFSLPSFPSFESGRAALSFCSILICSSLPTFILFSSLPLELSLPLFSPVSAVAIPLCVPFSPLFEGLSAANAAPCAIPLAILLKVPGLFNSFIAPRFSLLSRNNLVSDCSIISPIAFTIEPLSDNAFIVNTMIINIEKSISIIVYVKFPFNNDMAPEVISELVALS